MRIKGMMPYISLKQTIFTWFEYELLQIVLKLILDPNADVSISMHETLNYRGACKCVPIIHNYRGVCEYVPVIY